MEKEKKKKKAKLLIETPLPDPDIGGTVSKRNRVLFVIVVFIMLGLSFVFSLNALSRKTFEYKFYDDYVYNDTEDTGKSGYVLYGYNGNSSLKNVDISKVLEKKDGEWVETDEDVLAINSYTINSDEYVQYINIGPSVEYIEPNAFVNCKALRAFTVDENNPSYCAVDGVLYSKDMKTIISYPICHCTQIVLDDVKNYGEVKNIGRENIEEFKIEGTYVAGDEEASTLFTALKDFVKTTYEGDYEYLNEFSEFSELMDNNVYAPYIGTYYQVIKNDVDSVTFERFWTCDEKFKIPDTVETIMTKAFYKCSRLVEIELSENTKSIGDMAFFSCSSASMIKLPDGLETIGDDAFSYCTSMEYAVFIPASVKEIGHHCYYKCDENFVFYMGASDESQITLGRKWQPLNDNKFKPINDPVWGATREECEKYNEEKYAEAHKDDVETTEATESEEVKEVSTTTTTTDKYPLNTKALIVMVICFIPGFAYIGVQCIRSIFKEDFLMTKKGKERLAKRKAENEAIREAYVNGAFNEANAENNNTDEGKEENGNE